VGINLKSIGVQRDILFFFTPNHHDDTLKNPPRANGRKTQQQTPSPNHAQRSQSLTAVIKVSKSTNPEENRAVNENTVNRHEPRDNKQGERNPEPHPPVRLESFDCHNALKLNPPRTIIKARG
jgi:hypothetical protein